MIQISIRIGRKLREKITRKVALYLGIIASLITVASFIVNYLL